MNSALPGILAVALVVATACEREQRRFQKPSVPPMPQAERKAAISPGQPGPGMTSVAAAGAYNERNAYEISQGKRLFRWYNCAGCHSNGGGGMGPPLMDGAWRYGSDPEQVFQTIMGGRANGMPAFQGRIPEDQAWQIVAYVRSMSGLVPNDAMAGRADTLSAGEPEMRRDPIPPLPEAGKRTVRVP
ncbi:MAG TPA: c-type cytochrome [Usitatibacter sp.]|nr:c-type cytochrome [Usitatibacter sp.]